MIIIGIDPGIATTGVGVIEKVGNQHKVHHYSAILTASTLPLPERLNILFTELTAIITRYKPTSMAVESLFFNKNVKTALTVGQARGVILLAGERAKLPILHYTPPEIKLAVCGYGRADKKQVQQMVKTLLHLETVPKPDDVADALAIAICHSHSYRLKSIA